MGFGKGFIGWRGWRGRWRLSVLFFGRDGECSRGGHECRGAEGSGEFL